MKIIRQGRSQFVIRAKFIVGHARHTASQTVRLPAVPKNVHIIGHTYIDISCMYDTFYIVYYTLHSYFR